MRYPRPFAFRRQALVRYLDRIDEAQLEILEWIENWASLGCPIWELGISAPVRIDITHRKLPSEGLI